MPSLLRLGRRSTSRRSDSNVSSSSSTTSHQHHHHHKNDKAATANVSSCTKDNLKDDDNRSSTPPPSNGLLQQHPQKQSQKPPKQPPQVLEPPILVYHESARGIVFRDHLRRAMHRSESSSSSTVSAPATTTTTTTTTIPAARGHEDNGNVLPSSVPAANHPNSAHEKHPMVDEMETTTTTTVLTSEEADTQTAAGSPALPRIVPLPLLDLGPDDVFQPLLSSSATAATTTWTRAEKQVVQRLLNQTCVVKTIKNCEWTDFLQRFWTPKSTITPSRSRAPQPHDDIAALQAVDDRCRVCNSFVTSTSLLPPGGRKMRCYGSTSQYTVGVVFALPTQMTTKQGKTTTTTTTTTTTPLDEKEEAVATEKAELWAWPAGYSAKTEFNIDGRGRLINGRKEALVPLSVLRQYNRDYLEKQEYVVGQRLAQGMTQIPYNEVFVRVGGPAPTVAATPGDQQEMDALQSFDQGVGLPVALFVRSATYGHLLSLFRTRSRMMHVWSGSGNGVNAAAAVMEEYCKHLPLLLITPEDGVRVLTESLQKDLWQQAARNLNPFQNPSLAHSTTMASTDERSFQQKVDELLDLDESMQALLTPQELARLAGGFGATDASVAQFLQGVMMKDRKLNHQSSRHSQQQQQHDDNAQQNPSRQQLQPQSSLPLSQKLQDVVNEGLASAVRAGDYHTSRQLLILYSLVASMPDDSDSDDDEHEQGLAEMNRSGESKNDVVDSALSSGSLGRELELIQKDLALVVQNKNNKNKAAAAAMAGPLSTLPAPPPPPPLDTDRLRSATNSDGLLAVLGAAQVLKAMQDGMALKRVQESIDAVLEWVDHGEQSLAFRISSWYDQRAAQDDLKIAMENNSRFMAFVSNKAISNRKAFAEKLTVATQKFTDPASFLSAIHQVLQQMHSPCLRLELLQYVLGLDNRYSVAHVTRSVELAATCLGMGRMQQHQHQQQQQYHHD